MKQQKSVITSKVIPSIVIIIVTLIPTWIAVSGYVALGPDGFWEKFATIGCGVFFLGAAQVIFLIVGVGLLAVAIQDGW